MLTLTLGTCTSAVFEVGSPVNVGAPNCSLCGQKLPDCWQLGRELDASKLERSKSWKSVGRIGRRAHHTPALLNRVLLLTRRGHDVKERTGYVADRLRTLISFKIRVVGERYLHAPSGLVRMTSKSR